MKFRQSERLHSPEEDDQGSAELANRPASEVGGSQSAEQAILEMCSANLDSDLTTAQVTSEIKAKFPAGLAELLGPDLISLIEKNRISLKAGANLPETMRPGILEHVKQEINTYISSKQEIIRVYLEVMRNPGQFVETVSRLMDSPLAGDIPDSALRQLGLSYDKIGELIAERILKGVAEEVIAWLKSQNYQEPWIKLERQGASYIVSFAAKGHSVYTYNINRQNQTELEEFLSKFKNVSAKIGFRNVAGTPSSVYGQVLVIIEAK